MVSKILGSDVDAWCRHTLLSHSSARRVEYSVKDNPPAKDGLSVEECERIITSLLLEKVLATNPIWNAYE
jgi:hypothetical protein